MARVPAGTILMGALLNLLEAGLLFVSQHRFQRLVRLLKNLPDFGAGLGTDLLELFRRLVEDWLDLRLLLRSEIELRFDPLLHPLGEIVRMMAKMAPPAAPFVKGEECAGYAPGEKGENKTGNEFAFQGRVHWPKTVPIALSAIAYSSLGESSSSFRRSS